MIDVGEKRLARTTRTTVLSLLLFVALLNYLDRFIFGVLMPTIGQELSLSDAELGFLGGGTFSLIYAFAALPLSVLADRRSKRAVIAGSVMTWSVMTGICGFAHTFFQLALVRMLAGLGSAGVTAPTNALISEAFEPERRASALSIYALGLPLGVMLGFFVGSNLLTQFNWREVLVLAALPGILITPVLAHALPQPHPAQQETSRPLAVRTAVLGLLRKSSFLNTAIGCGLFTAVWLSLLTWLPTFFLRSHELSVQETGLTLALGLGISQGGGLVLGGLIGDRFAQKDPRAYLKLCSLSSLIAAPLLIMASTSASPMLSFAAVFAALFFGLMQGAPALAAIQSMATAGSRSLAASVYLIIINVIAGVGSQLVGILSDSWHTAFGADSLAMSLLAVVAIACPWSAMHYWLAARRHLDDLEIETFASNSVRSEAFQKR